MVSLLPRYPAAATAGPAAAGESLEALRARFAALRESLLPTAADFAARKMTPLLVAQARGLEAQLHCLGLTEEALCGLLALLAHRRRNGARWGSFLPPRFLLATHADTAARTSARSTPPPGSRMTGRTDHSSGRMFTLSPSLPGRERGALD